MTLTKNAPALRALIVTDVAAAEKSIKSRYLVVDGFFAAGYKSSDFKSPALKKKNGSTSTPEEYNWLKESVILGFTPADQALINLTGKAAIASLKPEKAERRTYVQRQIGSRMADYASALKRREETPEGAGGRKRDSMTRWYEHMSKAVNTLREESDFTFDADDMITYLEKAINLAKLSEKPAKPSK